MFNTKISSSTHTYNIVVQKGIKLDTELENTFYLMDRRFKSNFQVSENVFYLDALESCKNLQAVEDAIRAMVEKRINRTSQLIVVGGGLIQDVGTLVASLYMRGIKWIYVPTTFMAMVDSCIGGKSSINIANYKNIVGNIYPPQEIQIYTDFRCSFLIFQRHLCYSIYATREYRFSRIKVVTVTTGFTGAVQSQK